MYVAGTWGPETPLKPWWKNGKHLLYVKLSNEIVQTVEHETGY